MRLIDADELKEHLFVGADYDKAINDGIGKTDDAVFAFQCGWNDALKSVVQFAPTVDAEPVVRCKDCVYCKRYNDVWYLPKRDELLCTLYVETYHTTENDYCSRGERKDEVTDDKG